MIKNLQNIIKAGVDFNYKIDLRGYFIKGDRPQLNLIGPESIVLYGSIVSDGLVVFNEPAPLTKNWLSGDYLYSVVLLKAQSVNIFEVISGSTKIIKAVSAQTVKTDIRSHAKKVLDAIQAVIEGRATKDQQGYTINNRSLQLTPVNDLLAIRSKYKNEYLQELKNKNKDSLLKLHRISF